uniref:Ig-like domain-containing protein n=1 Tax=Latimeria chalumnae TaxID=7897 RepID=M3XJD2_LATCH
METNELVAQFIWGHTDTNINKHFKNRIALLNDVSLQINHLKMEDKGDYKVQLVMEQNQTTIFYNLQVYEHVSTPVRVVNTSSASHSGTCNVTLNCSVETGSQVQYSWSSEDGAVRDVFQHLSVSGAVLHLTLKPEDYSKSITCTASNPVSKESASVTL